MHRTGVDLACGPCSSRVAPFLPSETAEPTHQLLQNLPTLAAHLCKYVVRLEWSTPAYSCSPLWQLLVFQCFGSVRDSIHGWGASSFPSRNKGTTWYQGNRGTEQDSHSARPQSREATGGVQLKHSIPLKTSSEPCGLREEAERSLRGRG
ncbi:hypothetical protein CapIbe_015812 [Capra ibex]